MAEAEMEALKASGLHRSLRTWERLGGQKTGWRGATLVNFSSNDYLGLADCDVLKGVMMEAVARHGVGAGASRLVCGGLPPHERLEERLALFKRTEAALGFSSGHAAAIGTLPALCGAGDTLILDKLSHASLIDGARLSGATVRVFPHNHLGKLEKLLKGIREREPRGRVLVVTESIFSMDGDAAPLVEMVALKERYGAWLMVDEAHAVGVLGPQGRGLVAALGLEGQVEVQMGTLSKAVGVSGGYIAGSRSLIDLLVNRARSLIYSTAPAPAVVETAAAALDLLMGAEGERRRGRLEWNKRHLLELLGGISTTPAAAIVPVVLGAEAAAMAAAQQLLEAGWLVPAIRFPTVARGAARLRVTLSALHEALEIEGFVTDLRRFVG